MVREYDESIRIVIDVEDQYLAQVAAQIAMMPLNVVSLSLGNYTEPKVFQMQQLQQRRMTDAHRH